MNEDQRTLSVESPLSLPLVSDSDAIEWCLGLPLVGQRALSPEEVSELNKKTGRLQVQGWLTGCATPLIFLVAMGTLAVAEPSAQGFLPILIFLMLKPVAMIFLHSRDGFARSNGLKGDISAAFIKRFRGPVESYEGTLPHHLEEALTSPISATPSSPGSALPSVRRDIEIEVLPNSRRLWKVDGELKRHWTTVDVSSHARAPSSAAVAACVEPLPSSSLYKGTQPEISSQHYGRRDLLTAERDELIRRTRKLWLSQLWPALFLSAWIMIPLSLHLLLGAPIRVEPMAYFLGAAALYRDYLFFQALWNARLLKLDAQNGFVQVLRLPSSAQESQGGAVEVLPLSGWQWSEGGNPAPWRRQPI